MLDFPVLSCLSSRYRPRLSPTPLLRLPSRLISRFRPSPGPRLPLLPSPRLDLVCLSSPAPRLDLVCLSSPAPRLDLVCLSSPAPRLDLVCLSSPAPRLDLVCLASPAPRLDLVCLSSPAPRLDLVCLSSPAPRLDLVYLSYLATCLCVFELFACLLKYSKPLNFAHWFCVLLCCNWVHTPPVTVQSGQTWTQQNHTIGLRGLRMRSFNTNSEWRRLLHTPDELRRPTPTPLQPSPPSCNS